MTMDEILHVGRPNIGDPQKLHAWLDEILAARWLTNGGRLVRELEQRLSMLLEVEHCIATCNGTTALQIAIRALALQGEVILPSFTFIATPHALKWQGITPVFCDIDPETHNLDPSRVEALITPHTSGIIGVHAWGRPCETEKLASIARKHHLKLLFDAAHAFACSHRHSMVGNFGDCEVFSFHATKVFNTFEGGAITTNDAGLAEKIRLMKNFGFAGIDNVVSLGINGKMSEICAAMGLTNLESLGDFIETNRENYVRYAEELSSIPGLGLIHYDDREKNNFHYIVTEVDKDRTGIDRDALVSLLHSHNIRARRYFFPGCHRLEPYGDLSSRQANHLPATEKLCERVMVLPNGMATQPADIKRICAILKSGMSHARR